MTRQQLLLYIIWLYVKLFYKGIMMIDTIDIKCEKGLLAVLREPDFFYVNV